MVAPETVRVAVFIDWQNVYMAARRAFDLERMSVERGNFSPCRLGLLLAAANGRGAAGQLVRVEVHRGVPAQRRDPLGYAANRRQAAAWEAESPGLVVPRLRPLRYRKDPRQTPVEKGVDVALAVSAIEAMLTGKCDVAIVFSHDTDLLPVPEAIARLAGPDLWRSPLGLPAPLSKVSGRRHRCLVIGSRSESSKPSRRRSTTHVDPPAEPVPQLFERA